MAHLNHTHPQTHPQAVLVLRSLAVLLVLVALGVGSGALVGLALAKGFSFLHLAGLK